MSSLKSFVIWDEEDEENFDGVSDLALTLDRRDFSVDGYPINSKKYPLIGKALLRGKEKAALVEEDEKEDVEDIGVVGGTPSSSTANLESDDSLDDVVPLGQASVSHSVNRDFSRPNRNLDILDFDHLNISEKPSSVLAGPGGSSSKRRRVASVDARSSLGRPAADDDDRLCCLEEKIEEQERHRVEMERRLAAREDELKAFQEKRVAKARQRDEDAKAAQARMHQEIMQLLTAQMLAKKDSAVAPVIVSTSIAQPHSVTTVAPEVVPSVEVQRDVDLHMRDVSESPPRPLAESPPPLPKLPSRSPSRGVSSESSLGSAPT